METAPVKDGLRIGLVQMAPVFLNRDATLVRVIERLDQAAAEGCSLACFGETLVPGYPIWLDRTGGARFDDAEQKAMHALYLDQAVTPEEGHLDGVCAAARRHGLWVALGVAERAADRGGHTIYCTVVFIGPDGTVRSVHRKLMPTYEERLAWGAGDGAGLVTHRVGPFQVGALACWENWMPLARSALYAAGEDLHLALWPGCEHNTRDATRFIAFESRSFVASVSGLLRASDIPQTVPMRDRIVRGPDEMLLNGGTALAGPDGTWIADPVVGCETIVTADLDPARVRGERQNLDVSGHYARPDIFELRVDTRRQASVTRLES